MPTTKLPELRINGSDTIAERCGLKMGDGFIDTLTEPLTPKEQVENESRLEHGKRVIVDAEPKFKAREVMLDFTIEGSTPEEFADRKRMFLELIYKLNVNIQIPKVSDDVYRLIYKGKGTEYGMNYRRTFCHMALKFDEPDPTDRAPE